MGIRRPRCGLKISAPKQAPATNGRVASSRPPPPKRAVVRKAFWPWPRFEKVAGKARAGSIEIDRPSQRRRTCQQARPVRTSQAPSEAR